MHLVVVSSYWPRPEQVHKAFFEVDQVRALAELGYQVDVIVQTEAWRRRAPFMSAEALGLDEEKVKVQQITVPRLPEVFARHPLGALLNLYAAGLRMKAWLKGHEAKHGPVGGLIVHGERNIGLAAGIWNPDLKRPAVMIVHGADPVLEVLPEFFLKRYMGGMVNAGVGRVILVGNRLRGYCSRTGYSSDRFQVVPNGFHAPPVSRARLFGLKTPVRLLTAARLVAVKGIDDTIQALAKVRADHPELDWQLDILGDGSERPALESLKDRLGLNGWVSFHGAVPHDQVLWAMENSAIFVLPSWNEAFGLVYLEAMAMATAVVGCKGNGAEDILTNDLDGCLVPPRDVNALANVLARLISDPVWRDELASAAMSSVQRFSWKKNARAILEALEC